MYSENTQMIVPIDSPQFGRYGFGATMVGSIKTMVQEGG